MKKFKYKYKPYIFVIMALSVILALATIGMTIYRLINGYDPSKIFNAVITTLISLFIILLVTSMMISSYYAVDDKNFILRWGILKNVIPVKEITKLLYDSDKKKLTVYYGAEDNYMLVSLDKVNPIDIVDALRKRNAKILFESYSVADDDKRDSQ